MDTVIFVFQMRALRHREVEWFAQGHTACGWQELTYSKCHIYRNSTQGARYESGLGDISGGDAKVTSQAISEQAGDTHNNTNSAKDNSQTLLSTCYVWVL